IDVDLLEQVVVKRDRLRRRLLEEAVAVALTVTAGAVAPDAAEAGPVAARLAGPHVVVVGVERRVLVARDSVGRRQAQRGDGRRPTDGEPHAGSGLLAARPV